MIKRPLIGLLGAIALGIITIYWNRPAFYCAGTILFFCCVAEMIIWNNGKNGGNGSGSAKIKSKLNNRKLLIVSFLCAGYLAGGIRGLMILTNYQKNVAVYNQYAEKEHEIRAEGVVKAIIRKKDYIRVTLKNVNRIDELNKGGGGRYKVNLIFFGEDEKATKEIMVGDRIIVKGTPEELEGRNNDGEYDEQWWGLYSGVVCKIIDPKVVNIYRQKGVVYFLYSIRKKMEKVYENKLSDNSAGVISAVCVGERELLNADLNDNFQKAGVSHILAISGIHVSVIGMWLFEKMRLRRWSYLISGCIASISSVIYAMAAGGSVSAVRAVVMFSSMMLSLICCREYDGFSAMGLAGSIVLMVDPLSVFSPGLQYSFLTVIALILLKEVMDEYFVKVPLWLGGLTCSITSMVATMPLTCFYKYKIPVLGVVINIVVVPLMPAILITGLSGGIVSIVAEGGIIGDILLNMADRLVRVILWIIKVNDRLSLNSIVSGRPILLVVIISYALIILTLHLTKFKPRKCILLIPAIVILFYPRLLHDNSITFLAVGQGDGIIMSTRSGECVAVDGGSSSIKGVGEIIKSYINYNGFSGVDAWYISHCDVDHVSGLMEWLEEGERVKRIYFSEEVLCHEDDENYQAIVSLAKEQLIKIIYLRNDDYVMYSDVRLHAYSDREIRDNINDDSLIIVATYIKKEKSVFLGGDISTIVEDAIASQVVEPIDILKANHHGSKYSNGNVLLDRLSPEYCVISYGKDNLYGHPHDEAVSRIEKSGAKVLKTAENGQIRFRF